MDKTRVKKSEGGQWPDSTKVGYCSSKQCPQPLLDGLALVRMKSRQYGDERFATIQEVHNEALRIGLEILERSYEKHDLRVARRLAADKRRKSA